ncbi:MAG: rhodanese-like domain-containing protein [Clostridia bacterium]|nr:rhodanese-like domain-containing protein [Clostridia bacterium]
MRISSKEVYAMISSNKDICIVDVRDKYDYEIEHLPKSINIPIDILPFEAEEFIKNKSKYIILYSYSNQECELAIDILTNNGYSNVFSMGPYTKLSFEAEKEES